MASAAQAVSGFGFALIATPIVAVVAGPKAAVVGLTMIGLLLVAQLSLRGRGHVDRPTVLVVTVAAIVGMPLGLLVLTRADDRVLTVAIAVAVIAFSLLLWRGARLPGGPRPPAASPPSRSAPALPSPTLARSWSARGHTGRCRPCCGPTRRLPWSTAPPTTTARSVFGTGWSSSSSTPPASGWGSWSGWTWTTWTATGASSG